MDTKLSSTQILLLENLFIVKDTHSIMQIKRVSIYSTGNQILSQYQLSKPALIRTMINLIHPVIICNLPERSEERGTID